MRVVAQRVDANSDATTTCPRDAFQIPLKILFMLVYPAIRNERLQAFLSLGPANNTKGVATRAVVGYSCLARSIRPVRSQATTRAGIPLS